MTTETCRACLSRNKQLTSIFDETLDQVFSELTSIQISNDDDFPKEICLDCAKLLRDIRFFKQMCLQSDQELMKYSSLVIVKQEFVDFSETEVKEEIQDKFIEKDLTEKDPEVVGKKPYICVECGVGFANKKYLKRHMEVHSIIKKFQCSFCNKRFRRQSNLRVHVNGVHTKEETFNCEICNQVFLYSSALIMHRNKMHNTFECDECSQKFTTKFEIKTHLYVCNGATGLQDSTIDEKDPKISKIEAKIVVKQETMIDEIESVQNSENLKTESNYTKRVALECPHDNCSRVFYNKDRFEGHLRKHRGEKSEFCSLCGKGFASYRNMKRHMETHTNNKKYQCSFCDKKFLRRSNLEQHENGVHTKNNLFTCEICGQSFAYLSGLHIHKDTHTDVKNYQCNECPRQFKRKNELRLHLFRHRGIRNHVCDICSATFIEKHDLTIHQRNVHNSKREFKCTECEKDFKKKQKLIYHMRTHTNDRRYECNFCGKSFFERSTLKKHTYSHTGERPFKCTKCPKAYTESFILKRHMRQQHPE